MRTGYIYCLKEPASESIFYVGQTIIPILERLAQHICESKYWAAESKKCEIINKIIASGKEPIISILEEIEFTEIRELNKFERKWISHLSKSFILVNIVGNPTHKKPDFTKQQLELMSLLENVATPISVIEKQIGIPATVLQKSLKGKRTLPKRWSLLLKDYVEKKKYLVTIVTPPKTDKKDAKEEKTTESVGKHPLCKEGDPKEGSMKFYLKYDCYNYSELELKKQLK